MLCAKGFFGNQNVRVTVTNLIELIAGLSLYHVVWLSLERGVSSFVNTSRSQLLFTESLGRFNERHTLACNQLPQYDRVSSFEGATAVLNV